jgi:hypothetical protein
MCQPKVADCGTVLGVVVVEAAAAAGGATLDREQRFARKSIGAPARSNTYPYLPASAFTHQQAKIAADSMLDRGFV